MFPPPQLYEISKMANFRDINTFIKYAQEQSVKGCDRIVPFRLYVAGENTVLLPGKYVLIQSFETERNRIPLFFLERNQ